MRKKSRLLVPFGNVLGRSAKKQGWQGELHRHQVWAKWGTIVGPALATHVEPARWRGRTLVVTAANHAWIQELTFMKKDMLAKIRALAPDTIINDIHFEVGTLTTPRSSPRPETPSRSLSAEEREFIDQAAEQIDDTDTRHAALRAMTKAFQKRSNRS